jgi:hypothetical protein
MRGSLEFVRGHRLFKLSLDFVEHSQQGFDFRPILEPFRDHVQWRLGWSVTRRKSTQKFLP